MARPRDLSAGPQAEHASGVRAAESRVAFADAPETTDPGIPPVSSWCRRCVRLIGRDPSKAGPGFVCARHEHAPCQYCVNKTRQGCIPVPLQHHGLAANVIDSFGVWASASDEDLPQARDALRRHYRTFDQTVREPNLPEEQRQPARPRRSRRATSKTKKPRQP